MKVTCFSVGSVDFCNRHESDWPSGWPRCTEATNKEPIGVLPKAVTAWLQSEDAIEWLGVAFDWSDFGHGHLDAKARARLFVESGNDDVQAESE